MKKIKRHISLECFKSGYPGILPYFRRENQDNHIYTYDGEKIELEGINIDTEKFISEFDGNWREMPLDFKVQNDESTPKGTYEDGEYKIFSYADLNHRYYKAKTIKGIRLVKFVNGDDKRWKFAENPYEMQKDDNLVGISSFYDKSIENIEEDIETYGYVSSGDDEINNHAQYIYVVSDIECYKELQGDILIPFFENISGILRVDSDIIGRNVPGYISYIKIKPFYEWMENNKNIKEEGTHKRWINFGGDRMLQFLGKNINILNETVENINKYKFLYPKVSANLFLTSKTNKIGALSLDDTVVFTEKEDKLKSSLPKIETVAESRLIEVKSKFLSFDDNGNMLPGILKKKNDKGLYFLTRKNKEWIGNTLEEPLTYKEFNFIETAVKNYIKDESEDAKNLLITYDNGKILEEAKIDEDIDFFYINDENKRFWYKIKKDGGIEKIEYESYSWRFCETIEDGLKDIPDGKIVFLEKNVFDKNGNILYRNGTFVEKKEGLIAKVSTPQKTYRALKEESDYVKVKEGESYVYYGFTDCPDEGLIDFDEKKPSGKLFKTKKIVYCDLPYKENDAFNVVELSKWNKIFDVVVSSVSETTLTLKGDYVTPETGKEKIESNSILRTPNGAGYMYNDVTTVVLSNGDTVVTSKIPWIGITPSEKPMNVINMKAEGLADFVSDLKYNNDNTEVTIEYYISAKCNLKPNIKKDSNADTIVNSRPLYNYIDCDVEPIGGIKYTETYDLNKSKKKYLFDGEEIDCYINELDEEKHKEMVYNKNLNLSRYCQRAYIEYSSSEEKIYDKNPIFKNEFLNGIDHVNSPQIDVLFNRGNASTFENRFKLMECNTFQDLKNYGNNFFNIK